MCTHTHAYTIQLYSYSEQFLSVLNPRYDFFIERENKSRLRDKKMSINQII